MLMKPIAARTLCALCLVTLFVSAWSGVRADDKPAAPTAAEPALLERGEAVYARQCAECHGDKGRGVEGFYEKPFAGDRSLAWLTRRIERTMPEGAADQCVGEDARAVAAYLHTSFYAKPTQGRRSLQHLTVEQHRQSLADLIAAFREQPVIGAQRGLQVQVYAGRSMKQKDPPIAERIEATLDATYTPEHPLYEQFDELGHSVRWSGSLLAPETGVYEIVVRTDQAMRLWLNDGKARGGGISNEITDTDSVAFLDGWLQSEEKTEFRRKVFLLAGRAYPLMLEFSAHNQGVGNKQWQEKFKGKRTSYVSLSWVPPGRAEAVIPERHLLPERVSEVFVMDASFPPDDASMGFISGAEVSEAWLNASTKAAIQAADYIVEHLDELAGTGPKADDRRAAAEAFCERLVGRALRRPLTEAQAERYVGRFFDHEQDTDAATKRAVLSALLSPGFLYPAADTEHRGSTPDTFAVASRLALAMWDGLPDAALWQAAQEGALSTPEQIETHAGRMLQDPRAKAKLMRFFHHWLELDRAEHVSKDADLFPEFDAQLLSDLRMSLDLFIEHTVFSEASDYRALLLDDHLYVNERLAEVYGIDRSEPAGKGFTRAPVPADRRSGLITHPYLLTAFAYHDSTSPIHRGVFLTRNVIGRPLNPPPDAIAFNDAEFDPGLTMREKVTAVTRDAACMACHETINPLGFSLENFDSIGRFRTAEKGKPVNTASDFTDDRGRPLRLKGARDVAEFAAGSHAAHRAFVRQLFQHTVHRDPSDYDATTLDALTTGFEHNSFHIRRLFKQIALEAARHGVGSEQQRAQADTEPAADAHSGVSP